MGFQLSARKTYNLLQNTCIKHVGFIVNDLLSICCIYYLLKVALKAFTLNSSSSTVHYNVKMSVSVQYVAQQLLSQNLQAILSVIVAIFKQKVLFLL